MKNIAEVVPFASSLLGLTKCSVLKVFLKISQNSQEKIYARVFFLIKLQAGVGNYNEKEKFCKIFKSTCSTERLRAIALLAVKELFEIFLIKF